MYKKICEFCNQEFYAKINTQRFCDNEHKTNCCICGKEFILNKQQLRNNKDLKDFVCSDSCRLIKSKNKRLEKNNGVYLTKETKNKIKKTNLERYGGTGFASNSIKKKYIDTCNKKYGGINSGSLNLEKRYKTNLERYGGISPFNSKEIQDKIKENNLAKYGVEKPFQNKEIRLKATNNMKKSWKDNKNIILNKIKNTNLKKYNSEYVMQNEQIKKKSEQTKLEKYNDPHYTNSKKACITKVIRYGTSKYNNREKNKLTNLERYGIEYTCQLPQVINANRHMISKINKKFNKKLSEHNINSKYETRINNLSYDIEILNKNILIELDPSYTHQSTGNRFFGKNMKEPLDKNYHKNKILNAEKYGYRCIHIFDWDDWNKIIYLLQEKKNLYARKLKIKEVSKNECNDFLNKFHLQGTCRGQEIRLGLYLKDQLIQIMTFGKPRYNKNYEWELLRLCTNKDYKIVGGSEKLFKYFIKNYNPKSIISYCDRSKFTGEVYIKIGFKLKLVGEPNLHWSKNKDHITNNLLNQRGYDQLFGTRYGKGTSNKQLMIENGWFGIYDCGQNTYIWNKEENNE